MTRNHLLILGLLLCSTLRVSAQISDILERPCFVGSTLFMAANLLPDPPSYYQLNVGYRITAKDVLSLELITWTYQGPVGRPYGPHFENPESNFPGQVRAICAGLAYKRFLWKQWYGQVHATAFRQHYLDEAGDRLQSGFQLFNTVRLGYQFRFFKNRFFLEPSIAMTFWPINTNLPDSFQVEEDRWNTFFLGEPGLHFGFNF
ncbi:MAG: hypothetical protein AAFU60_07440 [Bacteroidota bacterium]